jgi:hypothetical protein
MEANRLLADQSQTEHLQLHGSHQFGRTPSHAHA